MEGEDYQKVITMGLSYIALRLRSEKEIKDYLTRKIQKFGFDLQILHRVTQRLRELGYVDDVSFALAFIRSQNTFRPKGKRIVFLLLKQKGVSAEAVSKAYERLDEEEGSSYAPTERELALQAATKRYRSLGRYSEKDRRTKLYSFLMRRGFDHDTIATVVDGLMSKGLQ
jgi:regulatory protein